MPIFWVAFWVLGVPISAIAFLASFGDVLFPIGDEGKEGFKKI
ncbi:MAG: hypothetical protein ACRCYP_03700 [Alphaproteobacteria bacterium]